MLEPLSLKPNLELEQIMKEDAIQMAQEAGPSNWLTAISLQSDDTHPVIPHPGLSELSMEPSRQASAEQPMALAWMEDEPPDSAYENSSLLEQNPYSIVNVTREYPFEFAMIMFGYIMPFVLVITLITNSLVIVVLSRRHMRTPTNLVLMTMAIVDIGTIVSPSPWYLYIYTFGNHDKFLFPASICYTHYLMTDVIPIFLHTSSIWLALLLASQRYIYVCHPTLARTWCTKPRVKRAIYTILLVAFLHQSTHFIDQNFLPTRVHQNGRIQKACRNEMAGWVSELGDTNYYLTYFTFRIVFVFVIPCAALLTLNILLFKALGRAEKKRTELLRRKFKLVDVQAGGISHPAADNQRPHLPVNKLSRHDPSSLALAAGFAAECQEPEACAQGMAKASSLKRAASMEDNQSCESISGALERARAHKSSSRSVDLEASGSRRLSTSSTKEEAAEDESEVESTCAECAALRSKHRNSLASRRCSLDETENTAARERHQNHQQSSQCSSMMGAGTNDEDVSSLTTINHHHRCPNGSMFARSQPTARRLNDSDDSDDSDNEAQINQSFNSSLSLGRAILTEKADSSQSHSNRYENERTHQEPDEAGLIKNSSSVESKLARCGCLTGHSRALRRVRMLSKIKLKSANGETSCCCGGSSTGCKPRAHSEKFSGQRTSCMEHGAQAPDGADKSAVGDRSTLVQVRVERSQQQEAKSSERRASDCNNRLFAPAGRRTKSPSFASSMGRASRASLAGSSACAIVPLPMAPPVSQAQQSGRTMDSNRTTLMLIVVVTVFLIVEVPVAIVTIIHVVLNMFEAFHNIDTFNKTFNYIKLFTNFFIMLSYSINFTIYCSMSKKFRETFRNIFCWGRFQRKRSIRMMYQTQAQPNEFGTVTQTPAAFAGGATALGRLPPLENPTSCMLGVELTEGRPLVVPNRAHRRSNSLKPIKLHRQTDGAGCDRERLEECAERQPCSGAIYSDYLATATTTLTTLDTRGSTIGQQQASSNGRLAANTSSSESSASISSSGNGQEGHLTPARPTPSITTTAATFKQRCKSMLNGGQSALQPRPQCQL